MSAFEKYFLRKLAACDSEAVQLFFSSEEVKLLFDRPTYHPKKEVILSLFGAAKFGDRMTDEVLGRLVAKGLDVSNPEVFGPLIKARSEGRITTIGGSNKLTQLQQLCIPIYAAGDIDWSRISQQELDYTLPKAASNMAVAGVNLLLERGANPVAYKCRALREYSIGLVSKKSKDYTFGGVIFAEKAECKAVGHALFDACKDTVQIKNLDSSALINLSNLAYIDAPLLTEIYGRADIRKHGQSLLPVLLHGNFPAFNVLRSTLSSEQKRDFYAAKDSELLALVASLSNEAGVEPSDSWKLVKADILSDLLSHGADPKKAIMAGEHLLGPKGKEVLGRIIANNELDRQLTSSTIEEMDLF